MPRSPSFRAMLRRVLAPRSVGSTVLFGAGVGLPAEGSEPGPTGAAAGAATALLIPVVPGLAWWAGSALGPSGRPQPAWRRAPGPSRALDRRRGVEGDAI